jgi:hypothetical protein
MVKLGLFESFPEESDLLEVKLGSAHDTFNSHNSMEYYIFMLKDVNKIPVFTKLSINKALKLIALEKIGEQLEDTNLFEFDTYKYHYPRGPPMLYT